MKKRVKQLIDLLNSQKQETVGKRNWHKLDYTIDKMFNGDTKVTIENVEIGFVFDKNGKFEGIYNWKK